MYKTKWSGPYVWIYTLIVASCSAEAENLIGCSVVGIAKRKETKIWFRDTPKAHSAIEKFVEKGKRNYVTVD